MPGNDYVSPFRSKLLSHLPRFIYRGYNPRDERYKSSECSLFELEQKKGRNIDLPDKVECFNQKLKEREGPVV